jgi:hypothetical protein
MSREKKIKLLIPMVVLLFFGAYGWHRHDERQSNITGRLQRRDMDEISGIAASGINDDIYYVHNDSGDTSRFFAMEPSGKVKSVIYFKGAVNTKHGVVDCEDIAVGPGPAKGKSYVYMGDIGDNDAERGSITVYRMEEKTGWAKDSISYADAAPIHFNYPDGPKDAETLMIDPIEKLIYIVSKRQDSATVYTSPLDYRPNEERILTKRCKLFFPGYKLFKWITAGDISKDGKQILLKSYTKVYYWKRTGDEPVWKTLQKPPQILPYIQEKQGEAIGFTPDGKGYYTTSEGVYSPIYYYRIPGT